MKVQPQEIEFLEKIVNTAKIIGIGDIIIEPGCVRAMNESNTAILLHTENIPSLSFGSVGLTNTDTFLARYQIAKEQHNFNITAITDDNFVKSFKMKGKGVSVEYRCANPINIKAPKLVNETFQYRIQLNEQCINLFNRGLTAMNTKDVNINSDKTVDFILTDINSDNFTGIITEDVTILDKTVENKLFSFRYPAKLMLDLFKHNTSGFFDVGSKGILSITINDFNVYVLPKV